MRELALRIKAPEGVMLAEVIVYVDAPCWWRRMLLRLVGSNHISCQWAEIPSGEQYRCSV
jgi:hypothetical protein